LVGEGGLFGPNESDQSGIKVGSENELDWLTPAISDALECIAEPHAAKKQHTVLLVAQALAMGESLRSVFGRDDTCKADVWYGLVRKGKRKAGWRDDPAIATALQLATDRARWYVRIKQGQAVENSLNILLDGAETAAQQLVNMVKMGVLVFDFGLDGMELRRADTSHVLEASKQILDRVSAITASKSTTVQQLDADQFAAIAQQAKAKAAPISAAAAAAWSPESQPADGSD
jgi:hypothetical protein